MKLICDCGAELIFENCTLTEIGVGVIKFFDVHKHWPQLITFVCDCGAHLESGLKKNGMMPNVERGMRDAKWIEEHLRHKPPPIIM